MKYSRRRRAPVAAAHYHHSPHTTEVGMANEDIEPDATPLDAGTRLMNEVAEQMDAIEADFGRDFEIGRVITVVEIKGPDGNVGVRVRAGQFPWRSTRMPDV